MLTVRGLDQYYGGSHTLRSIDLEVPAGACTAVLGRNGVGKTTLLRCLMGELPVRYGSVLLDGEDVTRLNPEARVRRGLVRTFQINQLFADLTPLETLSLAVSERLGHGAQWYRALGGEILAREVDQVANRFGLADVLDVRTDTLPYGKQRLLEIAVAFACSPRVLLLDEPAAGVPAAERRDVLDAIAALPADVSVLLIEHDMDVVFSFAQRISVLVDGALLVEGPPEAIAADPRVRAVYLGETAHG